jgi:hypothetical protein
MENKNLEEALLIANLMMNVSRGIDELSPQIMESEYDFMSEDDADEFYDVLVEFDFLHESFRRIESKYKEGKIIDMLELDFISHDLDLIRHYLENTDRLF